MTQCLQKVQNLCLLCLSHAVVLLRDQETHKFLALPIDEKTTHAARMMAKLKIELEGELEEEKEEEEKKEEKMNNLKHVKSKATLPKQITGRHELKMAMMKRGERRVKLYYLQLFKTHTCVSHHYLSSVPRKLYKREQT